jgi:photosystem II stability/assembly factor-like uncharacterized protein
VTARSDDGERWSHAVTAGSADLARVSANASGGVPGNVLLVGSQGAILRWRDGGRSWEALPSHTARHFNSMWADERSGDIVLVGERIVRLVRLVRQSSR